VLDLTEVERVSVDRRADLDEWLAGFEQLGVDLLADRGSRLGRGVDIQGPRQDPFEMSFEAGHPQLTPRGMPNCCASYTRYPGQPR
jgi:hypothetical protein